MAKEPYSEKPFKANEPLDPLAKDGDRLVSRTPKKEIIHIFEAKKGRFDPDSPFFEDNSGGFGAGQGLTLSGTQPEGFGFGDELPELPVTNDDLEKGGRFIKKPLREGPLLNLSYEKERSGLVHQLPPPVEQDSPRIWDKEKSSLLRKPGEKIIPQGILGPRPELGSTGEVPKHWEVPNKYGKEK